MQDLAKKIRNLRKKTGLTPNELSQRSGLSLGYIVKIETDGLVKGLSLKTAWHLAKGFDMPLKEFLDKIEALGQSNEEGDRRPSIQIIKNALRSNGYTQKQIEEIIRYVRFIKESK